jgi:hypothetical protein
MKKSFLFGISIIGTILLLGSCQAILKKMYDIKNPDIENESSILKFAKKYNLDTTNIVAFNAADYPEFVSGKSIPDADIFDKGGNYIEYRQTDTSCNAGLFQFIPELKSNTAFKRTNKKSLNTIYPKLRDLKGNPLKEIEAADFFVLIYWTVYTGKLNKDHVGIWEDLANKNPNAKIKVLKVNMDIQENWDKSQTDKYKKALKSGKKKK